MSASDGLFEVRVETTFEAGHRRDEAGRESPLHHHEWQVAVRARAARLDHIGLVIDFRVLRAAVDEIVAELDQRVLDDVDQLADIGTTAPAVAAWIFASLDRKLEELRLEAATGPGGSNEYRLDAVEVEADPGIRFEYRGG